MLRGGSSGLGDMRQRCASLQRSYPLPARVPARLQLPERLQARMPCQRTPVAARACCVAPYAYCYEWCGTRMAVWLAAWLSGWWCRLFADALLIARLCRCWQVSVCCLRWLCWLSLAVAFFSLSSCGAAAPVAVRASMLAERPALCLLRGPACLPSAAGTLPLHAAPVWSRLGASACVLDGVRVSAARLPRRGCYSWLVRCVGPVPSSIYAARALAFFRSGGLVGR